MVPVNVGCTQKFVSLLIFTFHCLQVILKAISLAKSRRGSLSESARRIWYVSSPNYFARVLKKGLVLCTIALEDDVVSLTSFLCSVEFVGLSRSKNEFEVRGQNLKLALELSKSRHAQNLMKLTISAIVRPCNGCGHSHLILYLIGPRFRPKREGFRFPNLKLKTSG